MGEKNRPGFACCAMRSAQTQRFHEPNVCTSRTRTLLTEKHATASSRREGEKVRSAPILRTCSWTVQTCSCVQATCPAPQHPCRVRRLRHCRQRLKTVRPLSHLSPHGRLRGRRGAAPISEWPTARDTFATDARCISRRPSPRARASSSTSTQKTRAARR